MSKERVIFSFCKFLQQSLHDYCQHDDTPITQQIFVKNLEQKRKHPDFHLDMRALLPEKLHWDFNEAYQLILNEVIQRLP